MRRCCVVVVSAFLSLVLFSEAQAKWIWTSETGWMNARAVPKATAEEQFSDATRLYEKKSYNRAYTAFSMVGRFYPESEYVAEADFLRGECLFLKEHYLKAYAVFESFLDNYPDNKRRSEAIEREIDIGKKFLAGAKKKFVGMKLFPAREKGVEIIERVTDRDPFHQRVPEVLMLLGDTRFKNCQYAEAREYYSRIIKEYAESDLRSEAEYQIILCDSNMIRDVAYDTSAFRKIEKRVTGEIASGDKQVIACGGGTVLFEENLRNLRKSSTLIHLTADPRTILKRVEGEGDVRPLLNVEDRLRKLNQLLQARQPGYQRAADHTIDTTGKTPRQVADEVMEALKH